MITESHKDLINGRPTTGAFLLTILSYLDYSDYNKVPFDLIILGEDNEELSNWLKMVKSFILATRPVEIQTLYSNLLKINKISILFIKGTIDDLQDIKDRFIVYEIKNGVIDVFNTFS